MSIFNKNKYLNSNYLNYSLALFLAILFCYFSFSKEFLIGGTDFFRLGDAAQSVSGWLFYRFDEWRIPLLYTKNLNYPDGASIALTDSIPLLALYFKSVSSWLPEDFSYFGYYVSLCFVLQAITGTYLIRTLGCKSFFSTVVICSFLLMWPSLLNRLGHTSLMSHFLLILNIAFYFNAKKYTSSRYLIFSLITTITSFLIHPYLFAMNFVIMVSALIDFQNEKIFKRIIFYGGFTVVTIGLFIFTLGYANGDSSGGGYSFYSMNVSSPICGGKYIKCTFDATGGQGFEGFNYFGLGLILLIFIYPFIKKDELLKTFNKVKEYKALIIGCVLLFIYSLSNKIYFFDSLIIHYELPKHLEYLTGTLRSSGRFFWPVGYITLFLILSFYLKKDNIKYKILLIFVTIIQFSDVSSKYENFKNVTNTSTVSTKSQYAWSKFLNSSSEFVLYPHFGCGLAVDYYLHFQYIAAKNKSKINVAYLARSKVDKCNKQNYEYNSNSLYITPIPKAAFDGILFPDLPNIFIELSKKGNCLSDNKYIYCVPDKHLNEFISIDLHGDLAPYKFKLYGTHIGYYPLPANNFFSHPRYTANLSDGIDFTKKKYPSFLAYVSGLGEAEIWGRWSIAKKVNFIFSDNLPNRFTLSFKGQAFGPNNSKKLVVKIGDIQKKIILLPEKNVYSIKFDLNNIPSKEINFIIPLPTSPASIGVNTDDRKLGFGFTSLHID